MIYNMNTKKEIEEIKNSPFAGLVKDLFGLDFDIIEKEIERQEALKKEEERKNNEKNVNEEDLLKLYKSLIDKGLVTSPKEFDVHFNDKNYGSEPTHDELVEDPKEPDFVMSCEDLKDWINKYMALINEFRKLSVLYGINFNGQLGIYQKTLDLIWSLIEKIFGQDNRDDIADFCYGNSNFDSVEDLYNELT